MSKDPNAVALGKKGGKVGGVARARALTADERKDGARLAARGRWDVPVATHTGELDLPSVGIKVPCYVLSDGRRVLSRLGFIESLDMSPGGQGDTELGNDRLLRFTSGKRMIPFVSEDLAVRIKEPLKFRGPGGGPAMHGYEASILPELCNAVIHAREGGKLMTQQDHIAARCLLLIQGLAHVGINALVDEATGYQYDRDRYALAEILETFIAKELAEWAKTFPDDFYNGLYRLRNVQRGGPTNKRPQYFGVLTNDIVYQRIAPAVLEELRNKNPRDEKGRRKNTHHQWLTRDHGHPKLREHLAMVIALMKISKKYSEFLQHLDTVAPKFGDTFQLPHMLPEADS